jgi:iron complex outermembrane receptor protein
LDDYGPTDSPSVAVYEDQVPLANLSLLNVNFFDLSRIEVVKGPQGTLYGQNATGGAINIISATPVDDFEAMASAGYGNYNTFTAEAMVNEPLDDKTQLRISAKTTQQQDGFWTNLQPGEPTNIGQQHMIEGRVQLAYEADDTLDGILKIEGSSLRGQLAQPKGCGKFFCDTDSDPFTGHWNGPFDLDNDQINVTSLIHKRFSFAELTSVTGYIGQDRSYYQDGDGTGSVAYQGHFHDLNQSASQELRLDGTSSLVDWTAGVFGSYDALVRNAGYNAHDIGVLLYQLLGNPAFENGLSSQIHLAQTNYTFAGYISPTWHITDNLDLITAGRLGYESKRFEGSTTWDPSAAPTTSASTHGYKDLIDRPVSYRVQLNWKAQENLLLYASVAQSEKQGGFFGSATTSDTQYAPYKNERVVAWEAGAKIQREKFFGGLSGFYYDDTNLQAVIRVPTVTGATIGNIPKARIYGADLDTSFVPFKGLTLSLDGGWLHSELAAFIGGAGPIPAGNKAPNAPNYTYSISASYVTSVAHNWDATFRVALESEAKQFKDATNDPTLVGQGYQNLDANIMFASIDNRWSLNLWGRNLTDEAHWVNGINANSLGIILHFYNDPRTFGFTVTRQFD